MFKKFVTAITAVAGLVLLVGCEETEPTGKTDQTAQTEKEEKKEEPKKEEKSNPAPAPKKSEKDVIKDDLTGTPMPSGKVEEVKVNENFGTEKEGDYIAVVFINQDDAAMGCPDVYQSMAAVVNAGFGSSKDLSTISMKSKQSGAVVASLEVSRAEFDAAGEKFNRYNISDNPEMNCR
ncbi:hypothetical protein [Paludifilum halophilum]|uniref:Lipoprotein n=1 Tax=Paludifilum halophilum TaxID=1642702 RepID=A0A235BAE0_9BACL|nr:hypothetical protein [Paludifilum halophilum]OYD08555.1 hypothetical protein CHM34_06940 [Paludifilum halophilum]